MRFVDPKTDFAFKRIFGSEDSKTALISFINASLRLEGDRLVESVEIKNPYLSADLPIMKEIHRGHRLHGQVGDPVLGGNAGQQRQGLRQPDDLYGGSRMLPSDGSPVGSDATGSGGKKDEGLLGTSGQGDDYPKLNDVVLISVMDFTLFEEPVRWCSRYILKEMETNYAPFNQLKLCCLELPKFEKTEKQLSGMLDKWAFFLKETGNLKVRPDALSDPVFDVAFEKAEVSGLSEQEKEAYDASIQEVLDKRGMIAAGLEKGEKMGREEGRKEGEKIGLEKGLKAAEKKSRQIAKSLLEKGVDVAIISESTGLSEQEIRKIKKS